MHGNSVTLWLRQLAAGDQIAAQRLWERYSTELKRLVRKRYRNSLNAVADESDVVQSVFHGLWKGAAAGRWDSVQDRTELWWLLLAITRRKAIKRRLHNSRQKRSAAKMSSAITPVRSESDLRPVDEVADDQPPAELILMLQEEHDRLMMLLRDDVLRTIAEWKLEGYTHGEIASKLGVAPRTIIRKLNLIREAWSRELVQKP